MWEPLENSRGTWGRYLCNEQEMTWAWNDMLVCLVYPWCPLYLEEREPQMQFGVKQTIITQEQVGMRYAPLTHAQALFYLEERKPQMRLGREKMVGTVWRGSLNHNNLGTKRREDTLRTAMSKLTNQREGERTTTRERRSSSCLSTYFGRSSPTIDMWWETESGGENEGG